MAGRRQTATLLVAMVAVVGTAWMLFELGHPAASHRMLYAGTPAEVLVVTPGRSILAYYAFIVALTMLPPLYFAAMLWLPGRAVRRATLLSRRAGRRVWPHWSLLYQGLSLLGVCFSAAVAGFAYEALRTEIRVSSGALEYRAGSQKAAIRREEVRAMVLRWRPQSQRIDLIARGRMLRIDLTTFEPPDRLLLAEGLPRWASLSNVSLQNADEQVWVRRGPRIAPKRPQ